MDLTLAPPALLPAAYPAAWEADVLLLDGTPVQLRPIRPDDRGLLVDLHGRLSGQTIHSRYFAAHPLLSDQELHHLVEVDYRARMAFVATDGGRLVGVVRYDRLARDEEAEVAFVVADAYQRRGVGTLLLEHLAAYARLEGVERFVAEVLQENAAMLRLFEDSGLAYRLGERADVLEVVLDTGPTPAYLARRDERERVAAGASIARVLRPGSVAVVGAGRRKNGVGHTIVRHLVTGEFAGAVYPVNPEGHPVCGVPAYTSLSALPESPDLCVVAVPAPAVLGVAREAAEAGAGALVVVSSGFAEMGPAGEALQSELLALARANRMRLVGPNCLGIANTDPGVSCNATFAPRMPPPGPIALLSQSGALGIALLEEAGRSGLGISSFVSVGNKLDVSSNDLLCYWERDEATSVVALYLESFGNPRKFARIARRVGRTKPIVALKAGRTPAGARGAISHTASAATPEVAVRALLDSCGVIQVERLEDLLDTVDVMAHVPLAAGRRVALVGNSGGPLILAADACAASGLLVEELDPDLHSQLASLLPPNSACANPVDITADGTAKDLAEALTLLLASPQVDAVVTVVTDVIALGPAEARRAVELAAGTGKPVVACLLGAPAGGDGDPGAGGTGRAAFIASPERAVAALGRACAYGEWRNRPEAPEEPPLVDTRAAARAVAKLLAEHPEGGWCSASEAAEVLAACEIPLVPSLHADALGEALEAADRLGYPVVLKAASGELVHKSDAGGVALDLRDPQALRAAYQQMSDRLGPRLGGVLVQPMRRVGVETIVGLSAEPVFGPLLMFGVGGTATNLLGDHAFAVPPIPGEEARRLLGAIRCAPLLTGYRGSTPVDLEALAGILRRVAELAAACPEVVELDLNPVLASPTGALVIDAKLRLQPAQPGPEPTMRLLRRPRALPPPVPVGGASDGQARRPVEHGEGGRP